MTNNQFVEEIISKAIRENLSYIDLSDKDLTSLPTQIFQVAGIKSLIAKNNLISALPKELLNLDLNELDLRGNPIPIPKEILDKTHEPESILDYYFALSNPPTRHLNEAKLMITGQGSVGKTSIVQRLVSDDFDSYQNKTEGISITRWQLHIQTDTKNEQSTIQLNIWDFGGQEIMHATHQFFLTKRSLYLLVLDSRLTQEENRVEYWLRIIQSFGGESPILIVGNKIDQHPLDIDRVGLQKKYPNIMGIFETSAATGAGIEELKTAIAEQVNNLPHVRDVLPETWFTVKTKLELMGREANFITHDKYLELCAENGVTDEVSQRALIGFLHDLGVVLDFQDDPRLESLGILNPLWVTNGVYTILNSRNLFQNKGVLNVSMLDEILNLPEYPRGKRLFIVDMMKKFELCYDIEADKTFLVPDLLPKDEPIGLQFSGIPAFEYVYPVLPSSIITRFIVRMNQKISDDFVWRTGILLKIGNNYALVKADIEDRKISIAIDGLEHTRRDTLSAIRYQFEEIHNSIKGLNPEKRVPIPEAPNAEPIEYNYLLMLEKQGQETFLVKDGDRLINLNVRQVLGGVESEQQRRQSDVGINVTNIYIGGEVQSSNLIAGNENTVAVNAQPDLLGSPSFVWNTVRDSLVKNNMQEFYINSNRLIRLLCEGASIKITDENMGTDYVYGALVDSGDAMPQLRLQKQFPIIIVGKTKKQVIEISETANQFIHRIKDKVDLDDRTALAFGVFIFIDELHETQDLINQTQLTSLVVIDKSKYEKIVRSEFPLNAFTEEIIHQVGQTKLNPYIYSGPIPYRIFYGREQEQKTVEEKINSSNYAVIANRRMGKTSFLFRISDRLKLSFKDNTVIYLDLQHVFTYVDFYKQLSVWLTNSSETNIPNEHEIPTFLSLNLIKMLRSKRSFGRIIMIMDEVDELLNYDCKNNEKLFRVFRSLSQTQNIRFIFSGTSVLVDRRNSSDSPLFNFCEEIVIGRLQKAPSEALIVEPMSNLGISFSNKTEVLQEILAFTDQHPTLIQYLCAKLVDKVFKEEKTILNVADMSTVLETQSNIDEIFNIIWGDVKSDEKVIVYLTWNLESFSKLDLMQLLRKRNLTLDNLDNKLRRLQYYSLLKVEKDRYKFSYKGFAKHYEVFHDIEELIEIEKMNMESKSLFAQFLNLFTKQTRKH